MRRDVAKSEAIGRLIKKMETFGYEPLPAKVSDESISFIAQGKRMVEVIISPLNLDKGRSISIDRCIRTLFQAGYSMCRAIFF